MLQTSKESLRVHLKRLNVPLKKYINSEEITTKAKNLNNFKKCFTHGEKYKRNRRF